MAPNTDLTNEAICDLEGQPLDRRAASLLKAVDKLLTVGAYYSADHGQYLVVSEKSCEQIVAAIRPGQTMAIEITAAGMMISTQLVDPNHRNCRLLHDLLVPLNIARLEIDAQLTPADLRQTISALQIHKQNLGNTEGFQEIKIENLPATVSTASRNVVQGQPKQRSGKPLSLDELLKSFDSSGGDSDNDPLMPESEKLAREFMTVVGRILDNLAQDPPEAGSSEAAHHPDSTPENIQALRSALQKLAEVNPDPGDLAHLIENAKRALDLSRDPRSVDLVFSLLKKEINHGPDGTSGPRRRKPNQAASAFELSIDQLRDTVDSLQKEGLPPSEPRPSARANYLGICCHLLGADPTDSLEVALAASLRKVVAGEEISRQDLYFFSDVVANIALKKNPAAVDRVVMAITAPLRAFKPDLLARFWLRLWEALDTDGQILVWPLLVSDLLLGLTKASPAGIEKMWLAAGRLDSKKAIGLVARLEAAPALAEKVVCPGLMALPPASMYPVHLALMKSSQANIHGERLHYHLRRKPPHDLAEILMTALPEYDSTHHALYLSLIKYHGGDPIPQGLRNRSSVLIGKALQDLPAHARQQDWVVKAIGWLGTLDPAFALPVLTGIRDQRKFFFFRAWPEECRRAAEAIIETDPVATPEKDVR